MLLFNVNKNEEGFTLTELMITGVVVSILAAIVAPNFLGLYDNYKVKSSFQELQGALQEAQRQAMRKSQTCKLQLDTVNIDGESRQRITVEKPGGDPNKYSGCLLSDRILDKNVTLTTTLSGNPPKLAFSFKGTTTDSGTIVLSRSDGSGEKKCLAISNGLGIMRTGIYNDSTSDCTTSE